MDKRQKNTSENTPKFTKIEIPIDGIILYSYANVFSMMADGNGTPLCEYLVERRGPGPLPFEDNYKRVVINEIPFVEMGDSYLGDLFVYEPVFDALFLNEDVSITDKTNKAVIAFKELKHNIGPDYVSNVDGTIIKKFGLNYNG